MHIITKRFSWIYGHRLHQQNVKPCLCRNLHGHSGLVTLSFRGDLTNGMVLDFNTVKDFKNQFLDLYDHKMFINLEDPLLGSWLTHYGMNLDHLVNYGYQTYGLQHKLKDAEKEFFDSLIISRFVPTSESLSQWIYFMCKEWNDLCCGVTLWETESSYAEFTEN